MNITSSNVVAGTVGVPLSFNLTAVTTFSGETFEGWSLTNSTNPPPFDGGTLAVGSVAGLPAGLSFNHSTGLLSGTPTSIGVTALHQWAYGIESGGTSGAGTVLTITINGVAQTISSFSVPNKNYGTGWSGNSFAVTTPAASSGLTSVLSVLSGPATISGTTVTVTGPGTVVLAANQPGNSTYAAAPQVTASFTVVTASISLSNLTQTTTGSPLPVTVTTTPPGLAHTVTYTGTGSTVYATSSTPPSAAGTYAVVATITDGSAPSIATASTAYTIILAITGTALVIPASVINIVMSTLAATISPAPLAAVYGDDFFLIVRFFDDSSTSLQPVSTALSLSLSEFPGGEILAVSDSWSLGVDTSGASFYILHVPLAGTPLLEALADAAKTPPGKSAMIAQLAWTQINPYHSLSVGPATIYQSLPPIEFDLYPALL